MMPPGTRFPAFMCPAVTLHLISMPLRDQDLHKHWQTAASQVWEGVHNRYWRLDTYMLPVCQLEDCRDSNTL